MPAQPLPKSAGQGPIDLEVFEVAKDRYGFARVDNVSITVWAASADEHAARRMAAVTTSLVARHPGGMSSVHWVKRGIELPSSAARAQFAEVLREQGHMFGDTAVILDGDGFWASAMRAMLTGLRILAGKTQGVRVCASIDEVVLWLPDQHLERTGSPIIASHLTDGLAELRARVGC